MKIGVLGSGTWGTALARMLALNGNEVVMWSALESEVKELCEKRVHPNLLGMKIPESIVITGDIKTALDGIEMAVFSVPSLYVRSVAKQAKPYISKDTIIVDVAKGIETDSLMTMTEVIADELGSTRLVALSGPTHAEEVAKDLPTTIVSASRDYDAALAVQKVFSNNVMRVYTNSDILGVELCGALKNIIALGAGIGGGTGCEGLSP